MDDADWSIGTVDTAEERQGYGMITTERDEAGEGLALLGPAFDFGIGLWLASEKCVVAFFDLLQSICVVIPINTLVYR